MASIDLTEQTFSRYADILSLGQRRLDTAQKWLEPRILLSSSSWCVERVEGRATVEVSRASVKAGDFEVHAPRFRVRVTADENIIFEARPTQALLPGDADAPWVEIGRVRVAPDNREEFEAALSRAFDQFVGIGAEAEAEAEEDDNDDWSGFEKF